MSEVVEKKEEKQKKPIVNLPKNIKIMGATTMTKQERRFFRMQMVAGHVAKLQRKSAKKTVLEYAKETQAPEGN